MNQEHAYFSIHSLQALQAGQFSIVRANIDNSPEKRDLAAKLYPASDFAIITHNVKHDLTPVIR